MTGFSPLTVHLAKTPGTGCDEVVPQSSSYVFPLVPVRGASEPASWPTLMSAEMPSPVKWLQFHVLERMDMILVKTGHF